jgi:hypothetical protein
VLAFCSLLFVLSSAPAMSWRLQGVVCGALLAELAVGVGGNFYPHHHIFAVPFFLAVLAGLLFELQERGTRLPQAQIAVVALALYAIILPKWNTVASFEAAARDIKSRDEIAVSAAAVIDSVLDKYGIDRYQWLGPAGFIAFPYTRHIPIGPLFFQQFIFFEGHYEWLAKQWETELPSAKILVLYQYNVGPATVFTENIVKERYRKLPNPLPAGFPYTIFLRNDVPEKK